MISLALRQLLAFIRRDFLVEASYRTSLFFRLVGSIFALWTFFYLSRTVGAHAESMKAYGGDYFRFALVGTSVASVLRNALGQFGRSVREAQVAGSLEALFVAPVSPAWLVACASAYTLLTALFQQVLLLLAGHFFFGAEFDHANLPAATLSLALGLLAFGSLGLLSAAMVLLFKRGDPLAWVLDAATALLSGALYPVEVLPNYLQVLAKMLPATYAIQALRENLLLGHGVAETAPQLLALAAFAVVSGLLAAGALTVALRRTERDGTLAHA
jgi:ABC-2 type transport system permease protein